MSILRRILFVLGFIPFSVYAFLRWIVTGANALELFDEFEQWRDQ